MGFPDVDLIQMLIESFPRLKSRFRSDPLEFRWRGDWFPVRAVRPLPCGIELVFENRRVLRLDLSDSPESSGKKRSRMTAIVLRDNPGFKLIRLLHKTDRVRHQSGAFLRILMQAGRRKRVAVVAPPHAPPEHRDRLLVSLLLWWDQLGLSPRSADALIYAPGHWSGQLDPFLGLLDIPVRCRPLPLRADAEWETGEFSSTRNPGSSNLDGARSILPGLSSLPLLLTQLMGLFPQLDLHPRKGNWELSYRGLRLVWTLPGKQLLIHPGEPLQSLESAAALLRPIIMRAILERRFPPRIPIDRFYEEAPERWLESEVVKNMQALIPGAAAPVYAQVPTYLGTHRKVLDLLTLDPHDRLVVLELKVEKELGLVFQALDYWRRVRGHLGNGDFSREGYFPGQTLSTAPPRVVLIAPLFEFHPVLPVLRRYLAEEIRFECIGISSDWRRNFRVLNRFEF